MQLTKSRSLNESIILDLRRSGSESSIGNGWSAVSGDETGNIH